MAKINWITKTELENKLQIEKDKLKYKGKDFSTLSTKEKDELLKLALEKLGLI